MNRRDPVDVSTLDSEASWEAGFVDGDEAVLALVYRRWSPVVYTLALR